MKPFTELPDRIISDIEVVCLMLPQHEPQIKHPNRPSTGLAYSVSSTVRYCFTDGNTLVCEPGMFIYLPQGCSYHVERLESGITCCVNFRLLPSGDPAVTESPFLLAAKDPEKTERLYSEMFRRWNGKQEGYLFRIRSLLYELFAEMTEQMSAPYFPTDTLRAFAESVTYMQENFSSELSVSALAAQCGVSEVYYRRIFKMKYGVSPYQYLSNLRVRYAKELLRSSLCSLESAGQMAGFSSSAYFCRQFRKITGMTPTEYRKQAFDGREIIDQNK